jgi:ATP-dependent Lhr-like helicase
VVLSAGTGSGKTEAVMAPLISKYLKNAVESDSLTILYIAPTKALVNDLDRRLYPYLNRLNLRVGVRHGDRDDMKLGHIPHVLITTPESLDVMLFRKDEALEGIYAVIIDEVHLIYNTQRGLHLSILLRRLRKLVNHPVQWAAISATMGNLRYVKDFLFGVNEEAEFLEDSNSREIDAQIRFLHYLEDLQDLFIKLIGSKNRKGKFLLFANSRRECEQIADILAENEELKPFVLAHYSSLSPEVRNDVETFFNQSTKAICIATSTLELGIDIGDIDAVFLYGPPPGVESFLQRIGRSNRRLKVTNVICCVRPDCNYPYLEALIFQALIELARQGILPTKEPYEFFGSAAQQALSCIGSTNGTFTRAADIADFCTHLPHINRKVTDMILESLAEKEYLKRHGFKNRYGAEENLYKLIDYRMIYGNFPVSSRQISISNGKKILGHVPSINLLRINRGSNIRFAGKKWKVVNSCSEGIEVIESGNQTHSIDIKYSGKGGATDAFVLNAVVELLCAGGFESDMYHPRERESVSLMVESIKKTVGNNSIPFIKKNGKYTYLTFSGKLVNKAIALITDQYEFEVSDTTLTCFTRINWNTIPINPKDYEKVFDHLFEADSDQTFYQSLLPDSLQRHEFLQNWLKDSTIKIQLSRLQRSMPIEVSCGHLKEWGLQ